MAHVTLSVVGGATLITSNAATASVAWDTTSASVPDGNYTLKAVAVDNAGNTSAAATIPVSVLNTPPPTFSITAPSPVAGSPTLSWSQSGLYSYTAMRGSTSLGAVNSPWTDNTNPGPGTYTYSITATDSAGNKTTASISIQVLAPSVTAPRDLSATSPTNAIPHLTWQQPVTFAVTSWEVFRDGQPLAAISDPSTTSFDDATVPAQGSYTYTVQAMQGATAGDMSSPVSVTYDTVPPVLGSLTAVSEPDGSVSVSWPPAVDPDPGSGIAGYVVRRNTGNAPPAGPTLGTAVCMLSPPATSCVDSTGVNGTTYNYSVFAIDGAGNVTRQWASARSVDTQPPSQVTGFHASVGPTSAHLMWSLPNRTGANADIAGYRIIQLSQGKTKPANPKDGNQVCPGLDYTDNDCFVLHLIQGRKTTFAIYAFDSVPNYSVPTMVTVSPHGDSTKPHAPRKVRVRRVGGRITMTWLSPKDPDLSHFVLTLNTTGPVRAPTAGHMVFKGRKLSASFTLKAGQITYANLFALDLSGNYSPRVYKLIIMPDKLAVPKKKHTVAKKKGASTPPKKPLAAKGA